MMTNFKIAKANLITNKSITKITIIVMSILWSCLYIYLNAVTNKYVLQVFNIEEPNAIQILFKIGIIAITIFLGVCIIFIFSYINKYNLKQRTKQFSLYVLNGLSYRQINTIIIIENTIMAIVTLSTVCVLSIFLAFITTLFTNQFSVYDIVIENDINGYLLITVLGLVVISYLLAALSFIIKIAKQKLDQGFKRESIAHRQIKSNGRQISVEFICSIILLICSTLLTRHFYINFEFDFMVIILFAVVGVIIFISTTIYGLRLLIPQKYYKRSFNAVVFSKVNQLLADNVLFIIISMFFIGSAIGIITMSQVYLDAKSSTVPTIQYSYQSTEQFDSDFKQSVSTIIEDYGGTTINLTEYFLVEKLGDEGETGLANVYKLSDLNNYLTSIGESNVTISSGNVLVLAGAYTDQQQTAITVGNDKYPVESYYTIPGQSSYYIFDDQLLNNTQLDVMSYHLLASVEASKEVEVSNKLQQQYEKNSYADRGIKFINKYQVVKTQFITSVTIGLISIIIAIILLLVIISIFAVKLLIDARDMKSEYRKLHELGMNNKELNKMISTLTNILILYPLIVAIVVWKIGFDFFIGILYIPIDVISVYSFAYQIVVAIIVLYLIYGLLIKHEYKAILTK